MAIELNQEYTAELDNWYINYKGTISGNIFKDIGKRWPEGTFINTSFLKDITPEGYIKTNNSVYKLLNPQEEAILENPDMKNELLKIIERYKKEGY